MTIDKAIKKIQYVIDDRPEIYSEEVLAALKLGIEALKRIKHLRGYAMTQVDTRLPGETEA